MLHYFKLLADHATSAIEENIRLINSYPVVVGLTIGGTLAVAFGVPILLPRDTARPRKPQFYPIVKSPIVYREFNKFKGKYLVIGCGEQSVIDVKGDEVVWGVEEECLMHPSSDFYSIDIRDMVKPDLIADVREWIPEEILPYNHFSLIFFEHIDNDVIFENGHALENAALRLEDNGIMFMTADVASNASFINQAFIQKLIDRGVTHGAIIGNDILIFSKNLPKVKCNKQPEIFLATLKTYQVNNNHDDEIALTELKSVINDSNPLAAEIVSVLQIKAYSVKCGK